jgi:orotate phosphoribosyltransferase
MMNKAELCSAIVAAASLRGNFRLRSGETSDQYFDKFQFEAQPSLMQAIASHMRTLVPPDVEVLAGLELGGIPVVAMLSSVTGIPAAFVRKQAKAYGTCKLAEGADVAGKRVVVVEDVVTSGGQVIASTSDLRELGAEVSDVVCVIDRESGGAENLARAGLRMHALFTMPELQVAASKSPAR